MLIIVTGPGAGNTFTHLAQRFPRARSLWPSPLTGIGLRARPPRELVTKVGQEYAGLSGGTHRGSSPGRLAIVGKDGVSVQRKHEVVTNRPRQIGVPTEPPMHETAQRIMTAAVDLFWERGFKQTTVRDITSACGLTQGALYIYFSSKDVLLADIVKYAFAILESHTVQTIDEQASSTSSETLCALVDSYVWYVVEHRKLAKVANLYWHELAPRERSTARAVRDGVTERFTRVIESGIADKSFTPLSAGETRLLPIGLLTMLNGIMDWHRPGGRLDRNAISLYFQEIALRLVGADIDTPPSRDLTS